MSKELAVKISGIGKTFYPTGGSETFKGTFVDIGRKLTHKTHKKHKKKQYSALKNINLDIRKGEFFGIVGRNGCGKSTLLKIIAGVYTPSKGAVTVKGTLTPFIELGVGFNPELSGRDNVFLNGALLGFTRKQMEAMYDDIVEFAELEEFMDTKLKNYSSGMQVRLAFSVAIKAESDVLLLDEVLAVGDADFQRKCYDYFLSLKKNKKTVILVTHDMGAVRLYCDRAAMIEKGEVAHIGKADVIAQEYQKLFIDTTNTDEVSNSESQVWGEGGVTVEKPKVEVSQNIIKVTTKYLAQKNLPAPVYGFVLYNQAGTEVLEANTIKEKIKTTSVTKNQRIELEWEFPNILPDGKYSLSVACCDQSTIHFYEWYNNILEFRVKKYTTTAGIVDPKIDVIIRSFS